MNRKAIRDAVEILPLVLFIVLTKFFSLKKRIALGGVLVSWIIRTNKKLNQRIIENLDLTMPNKSTLEKKRFVYECSKLIGKTFIELIFNAEFQKKISSFNHSESELKPLIEAHDQGRPIIIVSAHLGPWEAIRAVLRMNGLTAGAIYKKNKNQFYEALHLKAIKAGGEPIFSTGLTGTKTMVRHLKTGGIVAIMLDQAANDGEFFDFLGTPAKTSTSVAKIALKLDALLVPAYAVRGTKNDLIDVRFELPIKHTDYQDMTSKLTNSIQSRVLSTPLQWYWLHRRWKYKS
jgi:KDO2-lipid IV(A) lauroyltransferase